MEYLCWWYFSSLGGIWDQCLNFSFLYIVTNSNLNPEEGLRISLGSFKLKSKSKHPMRVLSWTSAEQNLPHQSANSDDTSRGAWPFNFWWFQSLGRLSIDMSSSCASMHPPEHHHSLTYFCLQQNLFYSYFSCSLSWFSACFPCYASTCTFRAYTLFLDVFL